MLRRRYRGLRARRAALFAGTCQRRVRQPPDDIVAARPAAGLFWPICPGRRACSSCSRRLACLTKRPLPQARPPRPPAPHAWVTARRNTLPGPHSASPSRPARSCVTGLRKHWRTAACCSLQVLLGF
ncbi:hypothetical protein [Lysobacter gummosus]|uniref:hypothetical protein n=1 Tax=Lysobacter gummosus TaxID=262324 RepID=UPI0036306F6F